MKSFHYWFSLLVLCAQTRSEICRSRAQTFWLHYCVLGSKISNTLLQLHFGRISFLSPIATSAVNVSMSNMLPPGTNKKEMLKGRVGVCSKFSFPSNLCPYGWWLKKIITKPTKCNLILGVPLSVCETRANPSTRHSFVLIPADIGRLSSESGPCFGAPWAGLQDSHLDLGGSWRDFHWLAERFQWQSINLNRE